MWANSSSSWRTWLEDRLSRPPACATDSAQMPNQPAARRPLDRTGLPVSNPLPALVHAGSDIAVVDGAYGSHLLLRQSRQPARAAIVLHLPRGFPAGNDGRDPIEH